MAIRQLSRRGFSILEMLIVMSIFSLIGTIVAVLFTQGSFQYRHGESHIEMQRAGRHLIGRVTPYVASMFDAENPALSPLITPAAADPNADPLDFIVFTTTEDWLSASFPSTVTSGILATSTADLRNYSYRIGLDGSDNVVLSRMIPDPGDPDALVEDTSLVLYRRIAGFEFVPQQTSDPNYSPKLQFNLVRANLLTLGFTLRSTETRGAINQKMSPVDETFRTTFNLPTKLL